jgi:hypothetical protein
VTIGAGQSSASFTVTTRLTGRDGEVTITATAAGSTRTARLSVLEARLTEFDINPRAINGALPARGTAVFSGPHSNPTLRLTSSDTTVVSSANVQLTPQSNTFSIPTRSTMRERTVTLTLECCGGSFTNTLRVLPMLLQIQVPPGSPLSGEPNFVDLTTRRFSGLWDSRNTGNENLVKIMMLLPGAAPGSLEAGLGPGLDVWSPKDSCLQTRGQFEIFEAVYGPSESGTSPAIGSIERFHAGFQRTCNFDPNRVIFGEISVSSLPTTPR